MTSTEQNEQRIADRLAGESIFVTGSTGFLAKVFVEKLLRAVPEIGQLFLLIRPRGDGVGAEHRARREVFGGNAFDRLRAAWGPGFDEKIAERVTVISGDLTLDRFGLDESAYRELASKVSLVVNSAATVTFDERLDMALALNIEGPRRLLRFAGDCGNVPFLHVSTCYVSGVQTGDIPETLLPAGHTVGSYIESQENGGSESNGSFSLDGTLKELHEEVARVEKDCATNGGSLRKRLIDLGMDYSARNGWNDTYTFTKWLAEQFVARDRGDVPLVLFRPAIIEGSYDEPAPGWIDGLRMADPLILAFGRGKLKEFPADPDIALDLIPVDFVANAMIATLPAGRKSRSLEIFQCGSGCRNPMRIRLITDGVREAFRRRPMRDEAGRPIRVTTMRTVLKDQFVKRWEKRQARVQKLRSFLKSTNLANGYRRKLASSEAQIAQLLYFVKIYAPYTHLDCRYRDDRLRAVFERMSPEDQALFPFDVERIDWHEYVVHRHVPGVRHFVLGAGMELEAPMLAAEQAVEDESPDAPSPMRVLASLRGETIFEVFESAAKAYPSRIALQVRRGNRWIRYTYGEALATTATIARRYEEYGLIEGDHIAICCENCPEWGLTYLAAMRSGLTVVPIDRQILPADVVEMARFADVKLMCVGSKEIDGIRDAIAERNGANPLPMAVMDATFVPPPGTSRDPGPAPVTVSGEDIASIVFTSGTTVAPKGVMLRHRNFLSNARSLVHAQPVQADDQFLSVLPMHHVFEFTGGFLVPISYASTVTYIEQLTGPEIISTMQATGTTIMMVVPKLLSMFHDGITRSVEQSGRATRMMFRLLGWLSDRSSVAMGRTLFGAVHKRFGGRLRMFVCGGSALPASLFHGFRRLGFPVYEGYGLTETTPVVTVNPAGGPKAGSVGLPLPEIDLDIRNQDENGVGELWVCGPNVMAGYYKNEKATADVIVDGWFKTGDLCKRDAMGFVYVTGRTKDVIITAAGKNVYPDEVAAHYTGLSDVKEMCVLGMPNSDGIGESVHAVIVLDLDGVAESDRSAVESGVRDRIARISQRIPSYQRIQNTHFWTEDLPRTTSLKVKRPEVMRRLLDQERPERRPSASRTSKAALHDTPLDNVSLPNEQWVRETVAKLVKREPHEIRGEDNLLLDLGIDSLMKIELLSEVEEQYGVALNDEVAVRVGRVSDLFALVGNRAPVGVAGRKSRSPRRVLSGLSKRAGANGKTPIPLVPVRWVVRGGIGVLFNSYIRVEAHGLEQVPRKGAFVLAANHSSHLDSGAVLSAMNRALRKTGRRCYIAGAKDYFFNTRLKSMFFGDICDTIPFDRAADGVEGLRLCGVTLTAGNPMLIFPEGTRSVTGEIQPFKIGVALLAVQAGVPIVPVHIHNSFDLLPKGGRLIRPGLIRISIGEAIHPMDRESLPDFESRYAAYKELTAIVQSAVESLGRSRRASHAN